MQSFLLAAALISGAAAQALTIITPVPGVAECQPTLVQWSGGTGPYFVSVNTNPAGTTPLVDFGQQSGTSLTWIVNVTLNTQLTFNIKDSTGLPATSAVFPVTAGSDSCLGGSGGGGGGAASGASTPAGGASTPVAPTSGSPAGPTSGGAGGAGTSGSPAKSSSAPGASNSTKAKPSAAQSVAVPAGILPALVAALGAGLYALPALLA